MPNHNEPSGLYLHIYSEPYEVECERCNGTGIIKGDPITSLTMKARCPVCHGTGKRRVRLTGMVAVEHEIEEEYCTMRLRCEGKTFLDEDALAEDAIRRYRADTLPASVREGLTLEVCE